EMTSESARRPEKLAPDRIIGHAQDRHSILGQRDRNAELGYALDELLGPVERIDDPYPARLEPRAVVGGFLGEPSVIRKIRPQDLFDRAVGLEVGAGDRVVPSLQAQLVGPALPVAAQNLTGRARRLDSKFQFALETA